MYKSCSRCGKIHDSRFKCNFGKVYRGGDERKLRSSYDWTKKSKEIRDSAQYLCEVCRDEGVFTYSGLEVHHIEKLKDRQDLLLDRDNLIVLCTRHHKDADAGKLSKDYLRKLVENRDRENIPVGSEDSIG